MTIVMPTGTNQEACELNNGSQCSASDTIVAGSLPKIFSASILPKSVATMTTVV